MTMMRQASIHQALVEHAHSLADKVALRGADCSLTYAQLQTAIQTAIQTQVQAWHSLSTQDQATVAIAVENHPAWVVLDLAALASDITLIPLPFFFSSTQWLHALQDAGANIIVTDQPDLFETLLTDRIAQQTQWTLAGKVLTQFRLHRSPKVALPADTAKVTYTSGTTGNPKGVCLSRENMTKVAVSIAKAAEISQHDIHLNVLPLATLLENIAGIYAPLLAGASCVLLPNDKIGLSGASGLDIQKLLSALEHTHASTAIFTPELLNAMVCAIEAGQKLPSSLRFLAVGGASVSPLLLKRAQQLFIPVYEGYGLSECASVVALNTPANNKIGSVGKLLPHVRIEFTPDYEVQSQKIQSQEVQDQEIQDQEIIISGNIHLGYVGQTTPQTEHIHTGDIGHIDTEGYLVITGRKKNIFITSFGRNVSPEWVERELTISPYIAQAAVFGEAKPWNTAIIVAKTGSSTDQINAAIQSINKTLPDYARVSQWISADAAFSLSNQQLTANGRNRRDKIWQCYQHRINALYERQYA